MTTNPVHPGLLLDQMLEDKSVLSSTFADETGLSSPLVSQIRRGNRRITQNTAQKIVEFFKDGDVFDWVRLQKDYDLFVKQQDATAS